METLNRDAYPQFQDGAVSISSGQYGFINLDAARPTPLSDDTTTIRQSDADVFHLGRYSDGDVLTAYAVPLANNPMFRLFLAKIVAEGDQYNTGNGVAPGTLWPIWF